MDIVFRHIYFTYDRHHHNTHYTYAVTTLYAPSRFSNGSLPPSRMFNVNLFIIGFSRAPVSYVILFPPSRSSDACIT